VLARCASPSFTQIAKLVLDLLLEVFVLYAKGPQCSIRAFF
jgi:hypothetical protein